MDHMTAKVSAFARAYHYKNNIEWIFEDAFAEKMLTEKEYEEIANSMAAGIEFFAPGFEGSRKEALRYIVDHQLSPSVLIRSAFVERSLQREMRLGCRQYVSFASGFDTYAFRGAPEIQVFELDRPEMIADKRAIVAHAGLKPSCNYRQVPCDLNEESWMDAVAEQGFDKEDRSFGSLLGISYYLTKDAFGKLVSGIGAMWSEGSAICFDYPVEEADKETTKNEQMAAAAGEKMQAKYSVEEMEALLSEAGFLVYEEYDANSASAEFCSHYNWLYEHRQIVSPKGSRYCLAVRK